MVGLPYSSRVHNFRDRGLLELRAPDQWKVAEVAMKAFVQPHLLCQLHLFLHRRPFSQSLMPWSLRGLTTTVCCMWGCHWRPPRSFSQSRIQCHRHWPCFDMYVTLHAPHWLLVCFWVKVKVVVAIYKILQGIWTGYLKDHLLTLPVQYGGVGALWITLIKQHHLSGFQKHIFSEAVPALCLCPSLLPYWSTLVCHYCVNYFRQGFSFFALGKSLYVK